MTPQSKFCLLVEDDPDDQEFFIDTLHAIASNIGCYAVSNGEEALFALMDENLAPDFIFTDLRMPRMDGFEFIQIVKRIQKFASIPIIVYTSDYSDETIERCARLGVKAVFSKTRPGALQGILNTCISTSTKFSSIL